MKPRTPENAERPLVLLVDDNVDGREALAEYLTFVGFRVEQAEDGLEAVAKAQALRPKVILMDLSLPVVDGWEATRRLRADHRTREIRVIALTAHALEAHARSALEAGCDAVVTKPFLPSEVATEVRRQLGAGTAA